MIESEPNPEMMEEREAMEAQAMLERVETVENLREFVTRFARVR